jgi:hypothetical protein
MMITSLLLMPALTFGQSQEEFLVSKSERSESFVLPYTAVNRGEENPLLYTFDEPREPNWIVALENNLSYVPRDGARTIIKILEPEPSEKYIELAIYGDQSQRYWVAVNTPEAGYARMYDMQDGWSSDEPISVTHTENGGLTVSNGKRTVVDRLDVDGFAAASIEVYGNDEDSGLASTHAGALAFEVMYGRLDQSPVYYVPAVAMAGTAALIVGLLVFKKRKRSD